MTLMRDLTGWRPRRGSVSPWRGDVAFHWSGLPACTAEEFPLVLLFQNLIGNAIKYRRPDVAPKIHLGAQKKEGMWHFSVTDNGIGIEPQHVDTIFAPFKRLHGSDVYPGSGLGLAICKKIVERAGGRIWAESVAHGSRFHFTLPDKD